MQDKFSHKPLEKGEDRHARASQAPFQASGQGNTAFRSILRIVRIASGQFAAFPYTMETRQTQRDASADDTDMRKQAFSMNPDSGARSDGSALGEIDHGSRIALRRWEPSNSQIECHPQRAPKSRVPDGICDKLGSAEQPEFSSRYPTMPSPPYNRPQRDDASRWSRRAFLASATAGTLAGTAAAALPAAQSDVARLRPNIIVILADDLGPGDLGCYGQARIQTPNIDRIAAAGLRFTEAYAGSTVCAPSRCCLMTGLHNGHGRVRDNIPHGVFLRPDDFTAGELLKQAGYRTGAFGKWGLGEPGTWGLPNMQGFDEFFGYLDQDHAHNYYPEFLWHNDREVLQPGNRANRRASYSAHTIFSHATRFVEENAQRPFFLYYAPTLPHWSDYPKDSPMSQDVPSDERYSSRDWPRVERNYAAMVALLDDQVGQILSQLQRLSIERQTLVLFASDNGPSAERLHRPAYFNSADGRRGTKRDLYEGGIRVPLLAQWKGTIAPGAVSGEVCAFWDFLPTAAELAGLPVPAATDGISLVPVLLGNPRKQHEYLYWDYGHGRERFSQAVRKGNWKAVRNGSQNPIELYDLSVDRAETSNVASQHPQLLKEMAELMEEAFVPSPDYPIADRKVQTR